MFFDGHMDIFTDVTIRRLLGETHVLENCHLARLQQAKLLGGCFAIWIDPPFTQNPGARLQQILHAISHEMAECTQMRLVHTVAELQQAVQDNVIAIVLGMEGLSGLESNVEKLHELYDFGVRHAMLTWNEQNAFATGAMGDPQRGLTDLGKEAIHIMQQRGMIVDVSHANERTFWDIVHCASTPLLASHSNARHLVDAPRNLTNDQLQAIAHTKGLVGLNSYRPFVGKNAGEQNVQGLLRHAAHMADLIGVEHLAFGFDFFEFLQSSTTEDFCQEEVPWIDGLEDCTHVPALLENMRAMGFSQEDIECIAYKNWFSFMERVLG